MSTNPAPDKPFSFTSQTLNSMLVIGLTTAILIPCFFVVILAFRDVRNGLKERRRLKKLGKLNGGGVNDIENQLGEKTNLELSGEEKNGGLCELEQPGLPELSAIGIVEMWDEGCAKEMCGKVVAVELDADKQPTLTSELSNQTSDVESEENSPVEMVRGEEIESVSSKIACLVAD